MFRVSGDVHTWQGKQVYINVSLRRLQAGTADIQIPAAQRKMQAIGRISDKGVGRLQRAI